MTDNDMIRGRPVKYAGVWAIATEPRYRKMGFVRELFDLALPEMRKRGAVLSILDPFNRPFYEKFDYALAEKRLKHVFTRDHLKDVRGTPGMTSRESICLDDDVDAIMEIERSMARFGSRCFVPKDILPEVTRQGQLYILEREDEPVGTASFSISDARPGYNLTVGLTRFKYDEVIPSILELVYNQSVNVKQVTWWSETALPFRHFLTDIYKADTFQIGSMMMRVVDFEGFCRSISVPPSASEPLTVEISDRFCPWNNGVYSLSPDGGIVGCDRVSLPAEVTLNAFQLSQVVSGMNPVRLLRSFGVVDCSPEAATRLESIFPPDEFISYYRF
jgi:predicted acetyltransferase